MKPLVQFGSLFVALATGLTGGCASTADKPPVSTAASVDLQRYMGPWYILASIPLSFEKGARNPVESYTLNPDGSTEGCQVVRQRRSITHREVALR